VVDPSDSNLWYAELLRRRSSGIEGIQEFYAVAAVPRSLQRCCVEMRLRRFSAGPPPLPGAAQLAMSQTSLYPTHAQVAPLETNLTNRYPTGTPVDELDVELVYFPNNTKVVRPVVADWVIFPVSGNQKHNDSVSIATLDTQNQGVSTGAAVIWAIYKTAVEAWLDMKKVEFETALLQSPLVNGKLFFRYLKLNTCFGPPLASLAVVDTVSVSPKKPSFLNLAARPPMPTRPAGRKSDLYRQAVFAWNSAEQQIGQAILHAPALPETEMRFDESKLVEFALRDLAGLDPGDPRNRRLRDAPD